MQRSSALQPTPMNIYQKLIEIVKNNVYDADDVEKHMVSDQHTKAIVDHFNLDSLDLWNIIMEIEEAIDISLDDGVLEQYVEHETVGDLVGHIVTEMLKNEIFINDKDGEKPITREQIAEKLGISVDDVKLEERSCTVTLGTTKDAINVILEAKSPQ